MALQEVDLVLVNHSHAAWVRAFSSAGFLAGPSNYLLAISKRLTELVRAEPQGEERMHVTRGDGDGRIHLA
jgi:predicted MPP superfamily phosphohydrolase